MSIIIKDLNKSYGETSVLRSFSLELADGSCTCLMGASGCGKTTLLRILASLEKADCGTVEGVGRCAFVFQEDRLLEMFTPIINVMLTAKKSVTQADAERCLSELGLSDSLFRPVRELSGGMKRRVAIARALLAESDTLLLDEAFKGLDEQTREGVIQTVLAYKGDRTLLAVTHDIEEAELFGARVITLTP